VSGLQTIQEQDGLKADRYKVQALEVLERERSSGRGATQYGLEARGQRMPSTFKTSASQIPRGCLAQGKRQRRDQARGPGQKGPSRCGCRAGECLPHSRAFLLGEELGHRGKMRNRIFPLVERELVLQAPSKNRQGEHEQPQWEQHGASAISRRMAQTLQPWSLSLGLGKTALRYKADSLLGMPPRRRRLHGDRPV